MSEHALLGPVRPAPLEAAGASRLSSVRISTLRLGALVLALATYGALSDPTPDRLGPAEIAVGVLLLLAVGPLQAGATVLTAGVRRPRRLPHEVPGWLLLVFGLGVSTWLGVTAGWNLGDVARDLLAHLFFLAPLFLCMGLATPERDRNVRVLTWTLAFVGVALAARFLLISGSSPGSIGQAIYVKDENLYLSADPTLLFAAVFLMARALTFRAASHAVRLLVGLALGSGALLVVSVFLLRGVRGPSILSVLAFGTLALHGLRRPRLATFVVIGAVATIAAVGLDQLQSVTELMLAKQELVGLNRRDLEFAAALDEASRSTRTLFLGLGWGAIFRNPAVDWAPVSFAHWSMTYFFLKTGLLGVILVLAYIASFALPLKRVFERDFGLGVALSMPLAVGLMINGSFRFLTFGMLLTLVQLAGFRRRA